MCVAIALTCLSWTASADKLAIVVSEQVNVGADDAYAWADELGAELANSSGVEVLSSSVVRSTLAERNVAPTCYLDPECLRDLGQRFGADEMMVLHVVQIAGQVQMDSTWYELGSGRSSARGSLSFKNNPAARANAMKTKGVTLRPGGGLQASAAGPDKPINLGLWLSAGATGALLVGAASFTLVAFNADEDAQECAESIEMNMPCNESLDKIKDRRDKRALTADILWVATGVAATTTVLFAIYGGSDSGGREEAPQIGLVPTEGGAAVSWGMRF